MAFCQHVVIAVEYGQSYVALSHIVIFEAAIQNGAVKWPLPTHLRSCAEAMRDPESGMAASGRTRRSIWLSRKTGHGTAAVSPPPDLS